MSTQWDEAYANAAHIENGEKYPDIWKGAAANFRAGEAVRASAELDIIYGNHHRQKFDLFRPAGTTAPRGLCVFVHGGYWLAFDKSCWSHLAQGCLAHGWAVAMPSYRLAPEASVAEIVQDVARAIETIAPVVDGPIRLVGHSAGGHLVARMVCEPSPLSETVRNRVVYTMTVSGLHDLRPLLHTEMGGKLFRNANEATTESPALLETRPGTRICCWTGALERPEFIRQGALLANIWTGLGADTRYVLEPDRHHFNVIDTLADPRSPLMAELLSEDQGLGTTGP